ncbi:HAD family hydrolase [Streptomyces roseicoloratus]|uniref:HAD family hydrolase n=1 Tax=Streptomyces roseicoloratus TaxID=2508722 RepID=A0ABY9RT55_9ACTN|nr:HAD family hydrolase [Streptomyces roseicoloratus]WMX44884.1 HAD family hydrolase [Streptomyces roseicoloratus]
MTIRAVLWDVDDTIFDYARADRAGMRAHLAVEGLLGRYGSVEQALGRWKELTELHWRRYEAGGGDWQEQRRARVRDFLAEPAMTAGEADAWFERYVAHYEAAWELFPDAVPVLDLLAGDYRHGVLSNSSIHAQDHKLRTLGVRERFEAVVCAAELGVAKPAAEAFHAACTALGLAPQQVAYVGDQPDIDARGAVEAGLLGVWLDRADSGGRPELTRITDLHQLPGVLRGDTRFGAPSSFG